MIKSLFIILILSVASTNYAKATDHNTILRNFKVECHESESKESLFVINIFDVPVAKQPPFSTGPFRTGKYTGSYSYRNSPERDIEVRTSWESGYSSASTYNFYFNDKAIGISGFTLRVFRETLINISGAFMKFSGYMYYYHQSGSKGDYPSLDCAIHKI